MTENSTDFENDTIIKPILLLGRTRYFFHENATVLFGSIFEQNKGKFLYASVISVLWCQDPREQSNVIHSAVFSDDIDYQEKAF